MSNHAKADSMFGVELDIGIGNVGGGWIKCSLSQIYLVLNEINIEFALLKFFSTLLFQKHFRVVRCVYGKQINRLGKLQLSQILHFPDSLDGNISAKTVQSG